MVFKEIVNLDDTGDVNESGLRYCECTSTPKSQPSNKKSSKLRRVRRKIKRKSIKQKIKRMGILNEITKLMNGKDSTANQECNLDSTLNGAQLNLSNTSDCIQLPSCSVCDTSSSIVNGNQGVKSKKKRKRSLSQKKANKVVIIDSDDDCVVISDNTCENNKVDNSDSVLCLSDTSVIELSDSEDIGVVAGTFETAKAGWENLKKSISDINTDRVQSKFDFMNNRDLNVLRHNLRKAIRPHSDLQNQHPQNQKEEKGTTCPQSNVPNNKSPTASHSHSISYLPPDSHSSGKNGRRPIVIDGSNVAFGHGKDKFSSKGIEICIDFFVRRKHEEIRVFIPQFRRRHPSTMDYEILDNLERKGYLIYTPSRLVGDKRITSYDDRFIVEYAAKTGGIVVSRDNFQDLLAENPAWGDTIRFRVLQYTFVGDMIMFPKDPLGRGGPTLDKFLMFD